MTEEQTTFTYTEVALKELDEQIAKAEARVTSLKEKRERIKDSAENDDRIAALGEGDAVSYAYGRAATRSIRNGVVRAISKNDKGLIQLKIETGEGMDSEFNVIDSAALLFTPAQVEAEQARINTIKEEAAAAAAAKAATTPEGAA